MTRPEPQAQPPAQGYETRDRISAAVISVVLLGVALLMADIATNGRFTRTFNRGPVEQAEAITREHA